MLASRTKARREQEAGFDSPRCAGQTAHARSAHPPSPEQDSVVAKKAENIKHVAEDEIQKP